MATYLDLRSDPNVGANAINLMLPDASNVAKTTAELRKIPEVDRIWTVQDFVPDNQERKLPMIRELARKLRPALRGGGYRARADRGANRGVAQEHIDTLNKLAGSASGAGADAAKRLAASLTNLSQADKAKRDRVEATFIVPLPTALNDLRDLLQAEPVSLQSLPAELKREWISADGQTRVRRSRRAIPTTTKRSGSSPARCCAVSRTPIGTPISILESGDTSSTRSSRPAPSRWCPSRSCCGSCCGALATCC